MDVIKYSPNRLYNCNETGLTVVQHKVNRVISLKEKWQVECVSSAERGFLHERSWPFLSSAISFS